MNSIIYKGDAVNVLHTLPDSSMDLIITDPPYESMEKHRKKGTTTRLTHSKKLEQRLVPDISERQVPRVAALQLGREFLGNDISVEAANAATERLNTTKELK